MFLDPDYIRSCANNRFYVHALVWKPTIVRLWGKDYIYHHSLSRD